LVWEIGFRFESTSACLLGEGRETMMEVGFRFESTSACMLEEGRESMMEVGGET
jgi:hypothetical protein